MEVEDKIGELEKLTAKIQDQIRELGRRKERLKFRIAWAKNIKDYLKNNTEELSNE